MQIRGKRKKDNALATESCNILMQKVKVVLWSYGKVGHNIPRERELKDSFLFCVCWELMLLVGNILSAGLLGKERKGKERKIFGL